MNQISLELGKNWVACHAEHVTGVNIILPYVQTRTRQLDRSKLRQVV